jgi:hypothetical protein
VEIKNRRSANYVSTPPWSFESVNARGIEGGGFYVVYSKNSFTYNGKEIFHGNSEYFWQAVYELASLTGETIPKVYGIHPKTANSAWFQEAVEEGNWTNLFEWVKDNIDTLPKDVIKKVSAYYEIESNRLGTVTAELLSPLLIKNDGIAAKYIKEIAGFHQHHQTRHIPTTLHVEGWACDEKDKEFFEKLNKEMRQKYPLLFRINNSVIGNCVANNGYTLNAEMAKELANYINMVDLYA